MQPSNLDGPRLPPEESPAADLPTAVPVTAEVVGRDRRPLRPTVLDPKPDPIALLAAFRKRWRVAVVGASVLAAAAGAAAYTLVPEPDYTSRALIHIAEKRPRDLYETRESNVSYSIYQSTQVALIRSQKVLAAALTHPGLADLPALQGLREPVAWLRQRLAVDFGGSEIMTISVTGEDPDLVAALVRAVTDTYLGQIVEKEGEERRERLDRLKELFQRYQEELRQDRQRYRELASTIGTGNAKSSAFRQQAAAEQLGEARRELVRLQSDLRLARAKLNVLERKEQGQPQAPEPEAPSESLDPLVELDPSVEEARSRLDRSRDRLAWARRVARQQAADPAVQHLEQEVRLQEKYLEGRREAVRVQLERERTGGLAIASESDAAQLQQQVAIFQEQEEMLRTEIDAIAEDMKTFDVKAMDLNWLEDEIKLRSEVARTVGAEVEAMRVELEAPPRIRLIETATAASLTDPMKKLKACGMAVIGTFGVFVLGVSFLELRSLRVDAAEEVGQGLGIQLLGCLPKLPPRRGRFATIQTAMLTESVDSIRAILIHAARVGALRTLMVTSAREGEGKSSLASQLGASLARSGRKTLLIDCDLRRPTLHRLQQTFDSPGLCELLLGEARLDQVIHPTRSEGLSLIPAGRMSLAAIDALAREDLRGVFATLREQFDFIVVDTAPAGVVADPLLIGQHVDAVLLSVLRNVTRLPALYAVYERYRSFGIRVLGAVVSGVPQSSPQYSYYRTRPSLDPPPAGAMPRP